MPSLSVTWELIHFSIMAMIFIKLSTYVMWQKPKLTAIFDNISLQEGKKGPTEEKKKKPHPFHEGFSHGSSNNAKGDFLCWGADAPFNRHRNCCPMDFRFPLGILQSIKEAIRNLNGVLCP